MGRMTPLGFLDSSIPGDLSSIQHYSRSPCALWLAHFDVLLAIKGGGPLVPRVFNLLLFGALQVGHLTFLQFMRCHLLLRILRSRQFRDWREEEEGEDWQEFGSWGRLSKFPPCSYWPLNLSRSVFSSNPSLFFPLSLYQPQQPLSWAGELRNVCQTWFRNPKAARAFLMLLPHLRSEIDLSLLPMISVRRQFPLLLQLLL